MESTKSLGKFMIFLKYFAGCVEVFLQLERFVDKQIAIPSHYSTYYAIYFSILYLNPLVLTK